MNIKIRKWKMEDKADLAKALSNKKVLDNLRDGLPYPYTEDDAKDFIEAMLASDEDKTFSFAITYDDKVIGSVGAFRQDNIHYRNAEIGYYIAEEYWGNGYMTSALKMLCDYVYDKSDIIRLFATPFANNIGSCRVLEKAEFTYEGTLSSAAYKNNKILDMKMYALVKEKADE